MRAAVLSAEPPRLEVADVAEPHPGTGEVGLRVTGCGICGSDLHVASTIGAGDGFASGFLYAMLKGLAVPECLHYGNAAAAIVVSRLSCSEAMPLISEVEEMMRQQRKT